MESLTQICISRICLQIREKKIDAKRLASLFPSEILEKLSPHISAFDQIKFFGWYCRWKKGVMTEKCNYKNGKMHGERIECDEKGRILEESQWRRGKKHGKYIRYAPSRNSIDSLENYRNGNLDGERIIFYSPDKIKKKEIYKKGKKQGPVFVYSQADFLIKKKNFVNGEKDGEFVWYDDEGVVKKTELWNLGHLVVKSKGKDFRVMSLSDCKKMFSR